MAKSKYYVGLEIGTTNVRVVAAEIKPDYSVRILGLSESGSAGVRKGEIVDINQIRACIKATLLDLEDRCRIKVGQVFVSVTGGHIKGVNNASKIVFKSDEHTVSEDDIFNIEESATNVKIPQENAQVMPLLREFRLDGQLNKTPPIGMMGKVLEAEYHIVHGVKARFQNTMRVIREASIAIEDIVFAPIAAAQVALTRQNKDEGALLIDIGGGTTDYVIYHEGSVLASGCIPIGGDHITNDIHLVTNIASTRAEEIKVKHGDVSGSEESLLGDIEIDSNYDLQLGTLDRRTLNLVITSRLRELFKLVRECIPNGMMKSIGAGIFLTGGVTKTKGIERLVEEAIPLKVHRPEIAELSGSDSYAKDPQLFTVLGLIYYAQILDQEEEAKDGPFGFLAKLFGQ